MSCCVAAELSVLTNQKSISEEVLLASRIVANNIREIRLSVPGIHCGGCIQQIEAALAALPGVEYTRVNLSTKAVLIRFQAYKVPAPFIETLNSMGYEAHLQDLAQGENDDTLKHLIRALAVAAFAASNIMLLSVSVWSGADDATRNMFHWISASIGLPAFVYSGRVFFASAWKALKHFQTNMDVPISVGILLALCMSLYETYQRQEHVYFDAAITLVFFLLIGRTLDHMMRERARTAVRGLAKLSSRGAMVLRSDGTREYLPITDIHPGMRIIVAAGERVPVDARVEIGQSEIDCALISGESLPQPACKGTDLSAGTLNLTAPLTVVATALPKDSFLAEMVRMMEAAEAGRPTYRRIADRAARLYAPVVHLTAALTFLGWMAFQGDMHHAATVAIAVLIITCPCALGLAVPMVQVVAARALFDHGIMVKDGAALERLAEIDAVVFDKTGTLTLAEIRLAEEIIIAENAFSIAASIASYSRHPYSQALTVAARERSIPISGADKVSEHTGSGVEATISGMTFRLGRADWALDDELSCHSHFPVVLSRAGKMCAGFGFKQDLRPDVAQSLRLICRLGYYVKIMSGDQEQPVRDLASELGLPFAFRMSPKEKTNQIQALANEGRHVLMVGDGLNDAPALAAAYASMAPASAADIGRNAADVVFLHQSLLAVPKVIAIAQRARVLIRQNLLLAVVYNMFAVPIAVMGYVTPLLAAVAMSTSSLLVIGNALRLNGKQTRKLGPLPPKMNGVTGLATGI